MCGHLSLHGVRSPADWNRSKQIWHVIKSIIFSCNFSVSSRNFSSWFPNFWYWFCNFAISSLNFWFSFRNFALSSFDFFSSSRKFSFAMTVKGHRTTAWILYRSNPVYTVYNTLCHIVYVTGVVSLYHEESKKWSKCSPLLNCSMVPNLWWIDDGLCRI